MYAMVDIYDEDRNNHWILSIILRICNFNHYKDLSRNFPENINHIFHSNITQRQSRDSQIEKCIQIAMSLFNANTAIHMEMSFAIVYSEETNDKYMSIKNMQFCHTHIDRCDIYRARRNNKLNSILTHINI